MLISKVILEVKLINVKIAIRHDLKLYKRKKVDSDLKGVQTAFNPVYTLNQVLISRPKDRQTNPRAKREIVYEIPCLDCNFVYYNQTKRSLKKRVGEHKDAVKISGPQF